MKTFTTQCLKSIAHLSRTMQDHIIADVTRYRLTGEIPDKMSPMRRALFNVLILMLDSETDSKDISAPEDPNDLKATEDTASEVAPKPEPNYVAIDAFGRTTPLYIPTKQEIPPGTFARNIPFGT